MFAFFNIRETKFSFPFILRLPLFGMHTPVKPSSSSLSIQVNLDNTQGRKLKCWLDSIESIQDWVSASILGTSPGVQYRKHPSGVRRQCCRVENTFFTWSALNHFALGTSFSLYINEGSFYVYLLIDY